MSVTLTRNDENEWLFSKELMNLTDRKDFHEILGLKKMRGYRVIHHEHDEKRCYTYTSSKKERIRISTDSQDFVQLCQKENRFAVGQWGDFELEYFVLLKDLHGIWYATQETSSKMLMNVDMAHLTYDLVHEICEILTSHRP